MRAYCRCTTVQNHTYDEAASKLRCKVRFLRDNIGSLPHQKIGDSVAFCDCELALIQAMCSVLPAGVPVGASQQQVASPVSALSSLRPAQGRSRTRSAS